jgi:prepilin-type N-terminal cleavage/methylation domain-containing protein
MRGKTAICGEQRNAFTLIEVLIVVIIMAVLAATIIPQFSDSTSDAKQSALEFNVHTLRSQIELYKIHGGSYPDTVADLISVTADGYGPYIDAVPENPFNGSSDEAAVSSVPTGPNASGEGWLYMKSTGQVWANCAEGF